MAFPVDGTVVVPDDARIPTREEIESADGDLTLCPYCHDYWANTASVRAHIRAKTDPDHRGKSGFESETDEALTDGGLVLDRETAEQMVSGDSESRDGAGIVELPDPEPEEEPDGSTAEASAEPDSTADTEPGTPNSDSVGVAGVVVGILLGLAIWAARKTGNEDQVQQRVRRR